MCICAVSNEQNTKVASASMLTSLLIGKAMVSLLIPHVFPTEIPLTSHISHSIVPCLHTVRTESDGTNGPTPIVSLRTYDKLCYPLNLVHSVLCGICQLAQQ